MAKRVRKTYPRPPAYIVWIEMRKRCYNKKLPAYPRYGGRGITVCDRWRFSYANFFADMGPNPKGMSLDRIDNNGCYEPGNCRWATTFTQARNKSNNVKFTLNGVTKTLKEWSEETGISRATLGRRRLLKWSDEDALTTPAISGVFRTHLSGIPEHLRPKAKDVSKRTVPK